mmetsp:Transcript_39752/g.65089  ORF Transcript_39752/g.65089 Transcript_39752/m.65089 type:complete len:282 (+) Transcript_39752:79-924(+)|eukprot:CAMPEP_0201958874 /NCGR_PEP_ID=MMETSP0904-20121228/5951_1 /ASSEMBLY_ACC=CAM_ASM_000553 /TAXON_ID=420261 /ORGANISM="Thalassiosira antarctica, Strain CCMP982" /LENGTH=281 /DNA_ID=CAMNT_0048504351 /DNA_START=6 /DNA_END=851 /DNA_ORIENTATION=+
MSNEHKYTPLSIDSAVPLDEAHTLDGRVVTLVDKETPTSEAQLYLEVVAPATLPEGYTFEAEQNGQAFTVKVPVGGVEEGQKFPVPFPSGSGSEGVEVLGVSRPVGHWKDGLYDCFKHGLCHPLLCTAIFCELVATGQVMHRLKLTWYGMEGSVAQTAATFRILLFVTIAINVANLFLRWLTLILFPIYEDEILPFELLRYIILFAHMTFAIVVIANTRQYIRHKYNIPEEECKGCEDYCCVVWCTCCTVTQMARHTADYETYDSICCSETGLPPHAPAVV